MKRIFITILFVILPCLYVVGSLARSVKVNNKFQRKKEINEYLYRRYIRPQLRSMLRDYFSLLNNLNPFYFHVKDIHESLNYFGDNFKNLYDSVLAGDDDDKLNAFFETSFSYIDILQGHILEALSIKDYLINKKREKLILNYLYVYPYLVEVSQKIIHVNYRLFDVYVVGREKSLFKKSFWDELEKEIWEMQLLFEKVIFLSLSREFENDFIMVWSSFFRIIQRKILPENNTDILLINLDKMNFTWNNFNKDMSKGGKLKSNRDLLTIGTIHNRWNSILKLILN